LLEGLRDRLGLSRTPRRIEVYDNSHIQGTNAVGAMVVAGPEGLVKNQYRKFNIKSADISPGDDYAMMREVLTRRFKRLVLEEQTGPALDEQQEPEAQAQGDASRITPAQPPPIDRRGGSALAFGVLRQDAETGIAADDDATRDVEEDQGLEFPQVPDLVLIDGGAGQLGVACQVFADLGVSDIAVCGIAKGPDRDAGREHFHMPGRARSFMLEARDPVLYFVQRLRDEAHRFAIGAHRTKRKAAVGANPLDEIAGIGSGRKRALLKHFGSAKAVSRAGVDDLKSVDGISAHMAQVIYDYFHERANR
jgi:excinuclease ABC subunit C